MTIDNWNELNKLISDNIINAYRAGKNGLKADSIQYSEELIKALNDIVIISKED